MEYTKIEISGYKRLALSNIQLIRVEPKHQIQLILGSNGSGKSALLREITPLPSHPAHYEAGGYKLLELIHQNHTYQVINHFDGKSGKYQLIKDGTDIFQGSTATDFRSLVRQEFGITPEIQTLIDGVIRFSIMDVAKRRYWFTLLSKADYTYAFQYYGRLRSRIRDLQGSLVITQNRYAVELSKVMSDEDIENTRKSLQLHRDVLHQLLETKPRGSNLKLDAEKRIKDGDQQIRLICNKLKELRLHISKQLYGLWSHTDMSPEFCQQTIYKLEAQLEHEQSRSDFLHRKLVELDDVNQKNKRLREVSKDDLEKRHEELLNNLSDLQRWLTYRFDPNISMQEFQSAFNSVYPNLTEILTLLPQDGYSHISRRTREQALSRDQDIKLLLVDLQPLIQRERSELSEMDHAKVHHKRTCPNCQHEWYHGYDERRYLAVKNSLDSHIERETSLLQEQQKTQERIVEIDRVLDLKNRYGQIIKSWPILKPVWELLMNEENSKPKQTQNILDGILRDIPCHLRMETTMKELTEIQELIHLAEVKLSTDTKIQEEFIKQTEQEFLDSQTKLNSYKSQIDRTEKLYNDMTITNSLSTELEKYLVTRDQHLQSLKDSLLTEHFNRLIQIFRQEVSSLEHVISKINLHQSLLYQLKQQIQEHEEQIRLLKMAEQALSPSTGLIAKGLTGFINWFIHRINLFVKHIWTYPLEILPLSIKDEVELDYKFPIEIDHRFTAPDIKPGECNASSCEVFDLAFRIIAAECLSLGNWPLQLDEFGASFDHKHRNVGFQVVTNLTTSTNIPQVFVVSHHEHSYNGLRNCDITVLNNENIVLPQDVVINGQTCIC